MATTIFRTAHSAVVRDAMDFSAALCGPTGETVAQAVTIPLQLGSIPNAMKTLFERFGDRFRPGDVYIVNDPFDGASHTPDVFVVKPSFAGETLLGFAVTVAHHGDIGGRVPGSCACDSTEVFQEGLRLPWLRLYARGEPVEDALRDHPRERAHPARADRRPQRAGRRLPHRRPRACRSSPGATAPTRLAALMADLLDHTERLLRARDRRAGPTGRRRSPTTWTRTGSTSATCRCTSTLTVRGDELIADFSRLGADGARRAQLHAVVRRGARLPHGDGRLRDRHPADGGRDCGRSR